MTLHLFSSRPTTAVERRAPPRMTVRPQGRESLVGDTLLAAALISQHDLALAAEYAERQHCSQIDAAVALGFVSEADAYAALARKSGMELIALAAVEPRLARATSTSSRRTRASSSGTA